MVELFELTKIREKLPRELKFCTFTAFVVGLFAYAYVFLNPIFIHDGSGLTFGKVDINSIINGATRMTWLSNFWYLLQDSVQVPWFAGCLSLILYGFSAFFACNALTIKSDLCLILITGIMVVQPALISSQVYGAGGLPFSVALFFSSLAAWSFFSEWNLRYVIFAFAVIVTIGTYTAYISWTAVIILIRDIEDILIKPPCPASVATP